ncbi:competence protein ComEC [Litoreibacter ponti]|uniref:Competence protein ComEC n=1 Tax=Litoreibacter ponti TaxID=1510457 RepID=A0A2T6BIN1_9RHOB|nr:ComEC/Rec2 family competence protein [Litoreibacter ponti]PTX55917.1 competence protein ComEC [Litoreibacter ponti]
MSLRAALGRVSGALGRQQGHLFAWTPVCLGTGVGLYFALPVEPPLAALIAMALGLGITWTILRVLGVHRGTWASIVLWALTLIALGTSLASLRTSHVAAPVLSYRYYGPIEGRVVAIDRSASEKMRLTLDQVRLDRVPLERRPLRVRVSLHGPEVISDIRPGDTVMTTGHLGPPSGPVEPGGFDFQRHLWFKQLGALGYTRNPVLRSGSWVDAPWSFPIWLYAKRLDIADAIKSRMGGTEGPFAAAILTGHRADLDAEAVEVLRASNLAHLLAISGLHMGLITGAVFALVRLCLSLIPPVALRVEARKLAAVAAFAAAFVYLGVSGASIATQRAFIMVSVMLLALCLDRPALSLRAVAIAALIVLVFTPEALIGPGFQMSFAATVALVAVFAAVRDFGLFSGLPRWARGTASLVLSSFIAGLATAPIAAAHFNQIAQYGLLANVLSVPVMGLVVMPGALVAGLLSAVGLEWIGLEVMRLGLAWILGVAHFVAGLGGSTSAVVAPGPMVLPLVTLGGLMLCLWQGAGRVAGVVPVLLSFALWAQTERPAVLISETGRLLGVMQDGVRVLNKPKGDGFAARVWLENDGDPVDQVQAAARADLSPNQVDLEVGPLRLIMDARNPEKIDVSRLCRADAYLLLPRVETPLPDGCLGWTAGDLIKDGAIALHIEDRGVRVVTSRALQGQRMWVPRARGAPGRETQKRPRPTSGRGLKLSNVEN